MEYWNTNVQEIRQPFDILHYFIIHETRAKGAECKLQVTSSKISSVLFWTIINQPSPSGR